MSKAEYKLSQYAEMTLVISHLRVAYNKLASMDPSGLSDDVCEKINKCAKMIEDTAMNLSQEKLNVLYELKMEFCGGMKEINRDALLSCTNEFVSEQDNEEKHD